MTRALSAVLFGLAVAAVIAGVRAERPDHEAPTEVVLAYEVPAGGHLDLLIPPEVERIKLVTYLLGADAGPRSPAVWHTYPLEITWLDPAGSEIGRREMYERTRSTEALPLGPRMAPNAHLPDDPRVVSDGRVTLLPARSWLPTGGVLRVRSPDAALLVRGFAEHAEGPGRSRPAHSRERRASISGRLGLPSWSMATESERTRAAARWWTKLAPRGRDGRDYERRWLARVDELPSLAEHQASALVLPARRSVALNLVGPVHLRLAGRAGLEAIEVAVVTEDGSTVRLPARPTEPRGVPGADRALALDVVADGAVSVRLTNPGTDAVGPFVALVHDVDPERFFGWTIGVPAAQLGLPDDDWAFAAPEYRLVRMYRAGLGHGAPRWATPWREAHVPVQLTVRPLLEGPDDRRERALVLRGLTLQGAELWRASALVQSVPAPFERRLDAGSADWVGEPVEVAATVPPATELLEVQVEGEDALVSLRTPGIPRVEHPLYAPPERALRPHYRHHHRTRWRLQHAHNDATLREAGRAEVIAANVRLVAEGEDDVEGRRYRSLRPASSALVERERTWLVAPADRGVPEPLYCGFAPGPEAAFAWTPEAVEALEGVLLGVLWTTGLDQLGGSWGVALDGRQWEGGRLAQRVRALRVDRTGPLGSVEVAGPPGLTVWLRTFGVPGPGCPRARRAVRALPLAPGASATWVVSKELVVQRIVVGGIASAPAQLQLTVRVPEIAGAPGLFPAVTQGDEVLVLEPEQEPDARQLRDPDRAGRLLASRTLALGGDLPRGRHEVAVRNLSLHPVWVRLALQDAGADLPEAPGPSMRWVRPEAGP